LDKNEQARRLREGPDVPVNAESASTTCIAELEAVKKSGQPLRDRRGSVALRSSIKGLQSRECNERSRKRFFHSFLPVCGFINHRELLSYLRVAGFWFR